jgi:DNA repair ATPase RecN
MAKVPKQEVDLKLTIDVLDDEGKVYDVKYRPLTRKENKLASLKKARSRYSKEFSGLISAIEDVEQSESDLEDMLKVIELTPEEDGDYTELLRQKVEISMALRKYKKVFTEVNASVKEANPDFNNLTEEYGKISLVELQMQVSGKDAKIILDLAKKDVTIATLIQVYLSEAYKAEMQGK